MNLIWTELSVICPLLKKPVIFDFVYILELFALELLKIAAFDFVYSLTSTNINQSAPNLVTMNMSVRSQMSLIMGQVIPDQSVLSALDIYI